MIAPDENPDERLRRPKERLHRSLEMLRNLEALQLPILQLRKRIEEELRDQKEQR